MNYWFINSMDKSQNKAQRSACSSVSLYAAQNQVKVICGDRIQSSGCLGVRKEIVWKRAQRNLWGDENILDLVWGGDYTKYAFVKLYEFRLRSIYFIVCKLYNHKLLFSVYIIMPVVIVIAEHCYLQYFLVLILFLT